MPDFNHPPFVSSATQQPRTLLRWLDVNPQGGPLGRTQTYIVLQPFNIAYTWNGYSEIVLAWNFEGPNNFSLRNFSGLVSNPNFLLCISWRDKSNNVFRYALWRDVGEVIYFNLPLYSGQLIKKNFRLEVWSTTQGTPANNPGFVNFYTSVLGINDYRYGVDGSLVNPDGAITTFGCVPFDRPNDVAPIGVTDQFAPDGIVSATVWNPDVGTGTFGYTVGGAGSVLEGHGLPNAMTIGTPSAEFTLSAATAQNNWYFILNPVYTGAVQTFIEIEDNPPSTQIVIGFLLDGDGNPEIGLTGLTVSTCPAPKGTVGIYLSIVGTVATLTAYDMLGNQIGTCSVNITAFQASFVFVNVANALYEVLHANNTYNFQQHLQAVYGGFTLPLTFPQGAVSQPN